jgi:hypothetical protein
MSEGFKATESEQEKTIIVARRSGLDAAHQRWLTEARGIDPEIALALGCCSVTLQFTNKRRAKAFLTPCILKGHEVAWSARFDLGGQAMKGFVSSADSRLNLVFAEQLDDNDHLLMSNAAMRSIAVEARESPGSIIVLTEGQLDALSVRMAGFCGISIPNGTKATHWLDRWGEKLENARRVVLWLDDDLDGNTLLDMLLSRLAGNVYIARPVREIEGQKVKDANDVLRIAGAGAIRDAVSGATMAIRSGANIRATRLWRPVTAFTTGIPWLDERLVLCTGEHTALIGRAGRGKTMLANFISYTAAKNHGEQVYYQSLEMIADGELSADLAAIEMGMPIDEILADQELYREALERVRSRFIALEPSRMPRSREPLLACANRIVEQANEGVRIHVVDNYSMVQSPSRGKNENAQMREDILFLNEVARRYDSAILVCYHARKPPPQYTIKNQPPELEDALGSSAIGNHCCLGLAIERVMQGSLDTNEANVAVRKARRQIHGRRSDFNIWWNHEKSCFEFGSNGFSNIEAGISRRNKGKQQEERSADVLPFVPRSNLDDDPTKY